MMLALGAVHSGSQQAIARLLANLLLFGLVVYVAIILAQTTWLVAWNDQPVTVGPQAGTQSAMRRDPLLGQPVAAYDFFGQREGQNRVAEVVRRSAPKTGLKLRLEGVLVAQHPEDSGAIVAGSDGVTEHYRVGDMLPGNAELVEVDPGRVLIRRNGRYESLTFDETSSSDLVTEVPDEPAQTSPDQFLENARAQLDSEGAEALAAYGLRPVEDGSTSGYVYDGSNAMLNAVNLKAGDVITAINGQPLGDVEQDKALLESWRSQSQLDIEIQRDGATLTVSYAIPEQWR